VALVPASAQELTFEVTHAEFDPARASVSLADRSTRIEPSITMSSRPRERTVRFRVVDAADRTVPETGAFFLSGRGVLAVGRSWAEASAFSPATHVVAIDAIQRAASGGQKLVFRREGYRDVEFAAADLLTASAVVPVTLEVAPRVAVRITTPAGAPVAGARLLLFDRTVPGHRGDILASVPTRHSDDAGRALIPHGAPRSDIPALLVVSKPGLGIACAPVRPTAGREFLIVLGGRAASIEGRVTDAEGNPVAARIRIQAADEWARRGLRLFRSAMADEEGRFTIRGLPSGVRFTLLSTWTVYASEGGKANRVFEGRSGPHDPAPDSHIDLRLAPR
jgi:hypothetical protein